MSTPTAVGPLADFPPGAARRVFVDGVPIAVVRTDEGVFAVADRCSHADVSLAEGEVEDCAIECWLHGSAFDLRTGAPLSLPAIEPVATYRVTVAGDGDDAQILIDPTPRRGTEDS
jgi:nitrite reductase/ring-hydroxylating ferredoxin subunit